MTTLRPPKSVQFLNKWVDSYARELGQPPVRVRNWVSHMVLGGALQDAGSDEAGGKFTIKGGVALELRLRYIARATRDLDLILESGEGDPVELLEEKLAQPYQGFTFRRKRPAEVMPNGAARVEIGLDYRGRAWGTVQVDVARREPGRADVEMVDAFSLAPFGLEGPQSLPCLSLPYHVAQKIHAATYVASDGRRNERFRDLIDLVLMQGWITDFDAVRAACQDVFTSRNTHPWPPLLTVPEHWEVPFRRMATELDVPIIDAYEAALLVRRFISTVDNAAPWAGKLARIDHLSATTWYFAWGADGRFHRLPATVGESFFTSGASKKDRIRDEWQHDPGGLALFGVVLFLRDRQPCYVESISFDCFPLDKRAEGKAVEFGGPAWKQLAEQILLSCNAPLRAVSDLGIFLSRSVARLPCVIAEVAGDSTKHHHWARVQWNYDWFLWDLHNAQPVSGSR